MNDLDHLFVFSLDAQPFALPLAAVERVVRSVEVTPLPRMPQVILGVINLQGRIIPVINLRKLFGLEAADAPPELELSDYLIIVHGAQRTMALLVSAVSGVMRCADGEVAAAEAVLPRMECIAGVVKREDAIVAVCDPDALVSVIGERFLEAAMPVEEATEAGAP
ncbi:MAG TPA: chemotaxis protein CheW [Abditibacteriaceae bacterium]|nr:chemotaxis protein CheW [Abditibacteriaceae bacterium]